MKILKKFAKILLITIAGLLALILLILSALHIAKYFIYPDYYHNIERISPIPALNSGFVPQGLSYDAENDTYVHSGYHGKYVELYLVSGNETKALTLLNTDGSRAEGHGGGVAVAGDYLYISDSQKIDGVKTGVLLIYRYADVLNAENGEEVTAIDTAIVDTDGAAFCFADENYLYVGEFYRAGNYETPESHYYTTPAGEQNKAIFSAYPLTADGALADAYPEYSCSITGLVQGVAITADGKIALSRSWGLNPSYLEIHSGMKDSGTTIGVSGKEVPLYYLDSTTREQNVKLPAFSEGLTLTANGEVAITFESACNSYIVGKFFFANKVVAYPVD
ncbi:MAG: hypothetical protein IJW92_04995 [Clostridia bacterium]|nr:hypothetical protein [Clostridia bacterium]